jgi:hypothetical protein
MKKRSKFPQLVRIIDDGAQDPQDDLSQALIGCELHPDHGICLGWEKPVWLVFGIKVNELKKRYPEIFRRFREEIRIFFGDTLVFGGSECEIIS